MIKYGFFNAKKLITGDYDRKYNAEDVNNYFKGAISRDGIFQFVGNQCRVITAGGMNVAIRDGKGQINYHWFEVTSNEILPIREAHATLNRYTAIVARYDAANRNIYLLAIDGTESEKPSKPQIQRTDTLRDICLAYVYVAAGATAITSNDIEDAVENVEVCGFVSTLLAGTGGVKKVHQLPIPSRTCQGDIYYLIEESKTAGRTYIKGYYYCEPSRTEYDYVDFDWTSDVLSNRPIASESYVDILFFANDTNKWYGCVEVSENTYEWQEVVVNEVEELPEPTEDINNQFYIIGNILYRVAKQESNYKWYMFGVGGGGGQGDFAIIKIEYPEGTEVQVTFDGDTIDAPDTTGTWLFGCDGVGIYTVGIKNTSVVKDVEITTAGQVENVYISPQVINYALIYYLGNEFTNVAGTDEKKYAISTGGWEGSSVGVSKLAAAQKFSTNININTNNFSASFVYSKRQVSMLSNADANLGEDIYCGTGSVSLSSKNISFSNNKYIENIYCQRLSGTSSITTRGFNLGNAVAENLIISLVAEYYWYGASSGSNFEISTFSKNSNHLFLKGQDKYVNEGYASATWGCGTTCFYACGFVKTDDLTGLSTYGSTITEILNNSTALFEDITALQWMVLNCTGDFMITALSNSNFINAMNTSPNKTILQANEHWARFLALLSV